MKTTIIIIILFFQLSIFGQSSFKKYKDIKTGAITAYADGIKLIKVEKTSWSNNSKTIGELKPKFNNGKYYLKFTSDEIQQSLGELSEVWEFCFFNSKSDNTCYLRMYLSINDNKIIKLIGKAKIKNISDIDAFDFVMNQKDFFDIANANSLSVKLSTTELDDFENFPYTFKFEELYGLRDFCEGMNISFLSK